MPLVALCPIHLCLCSRSYYEDLMAGSRVLLRASRSPHALQWLTRPHSWLRNRIIHSRAHTDIHLHTHTHTHGECANVQWLVSGLSIERFKSQAPLNKLMYNLYMYMYDELNSL